MNSPKVSVIVPVYRAEKYLHRCVDSLLAQTLVDFEVILIDDGSPDASGEICDEYACQDSRVKVLHKRNGGVSSARQCGVEQASGEYIIHVDPDDWVEHTMLEVLYNAALEGNFDMVICDFFCEYSTEKHYVSQKPSSLNHCDVLKDLFINLHGSCCNKLVRSIYYKSTIFPSDMSLCEDLYVIASILLSPITITYVPMAFYHYVQDDNPASLTKIRNSTIDYDLFLLKKFTQLLAGTKYVKYARSKFSFQIVASSYARKEFSSMQFVNKCGRYLYYVITRDEAPFYYRFKLLMSCLGFYRMMLFVDNLKSK